MKILFVFLICLSIPILGNAQTNLSGFIAPTDSLASILQGENILYLPKDGFTLYGSPSTKDSLGKIIPLMANEKALKPPKFRDLTQAELYLIGDKPKIISGYDYAFKTYEDCLHLHFSDYQNGFVKVLDNYESSAFWISENEVTTKGFKLTHWIDFYGTVGMYITTCPNSTISLLQSPYNDSETLTEIDENHFEVKVIYFDESEAVCCEGLFCYVEATQYKVHPCFGGTYDKENIVQKLKGWIKVIDEQGNRLIKHNAGGC
jgi:hypothetical protein